MLSIGKPITDAAAAENYYTQNGKDDYYSKNNIGVWFGKGAERLGLSGEINHQDYSNIIRGLNKDGAPLGEATKRDRRIGVDFTFSAPKSVSILYEIYHHEDLLTAHRVAVEKALTKLENDFTITRKTTSGITERSKTENIVAATFNHHASRELDPQLHTHCVVMNLTQRNDGEWRAIDYETAYKARLFMSQTYQNELAFELNKLGYALDIKENHTYEIKGVPEEMIEEFSKRRAQVLERALEIKNNNPHISNKKIFEMAALDSRITKKEIGHEELYEIWTDIAKEYDLNIQKNDKNIDISREDRARIALLEAGKILTENESVFELKQLSVVAMKQGLSEITETDIQKAYRELEGVSFVKLGEVHNRHKSDTLVTTKEIFDIEQKIVEKIIAGKNTSSFIAEPDKVSAAIEQYSAMLEKKTGNTLTAGQKKAAELILGSNDKYLGIQGDAGTGKTTMLAAVKDITQDKITIRGFAPTGKAAAEIEKNSGIKSLTIDYFLGSFAGDMANGNFGKNEIWVVDESSMVDSRKFLKIVEAADVAQAKVVFVGDVKQLQAVGAGKMFQKLQELSAFEFVQMSDVVRQTTDNARDIVNSFSNKEIDKTFEVLEKKNKILEVKNEDVSLVVDDYVKSYKKDKNTLLVSTLNETVAKLNEDIRQHLKLEAQLSISDKEVVVRQVVNIIGLKKYDSKNYQIGQQLFFRENVGDFKAGQEAEIVSINTTKNSLDIKIVDNSSKKYIIKSLELTNYDYPLALSVFAEKKLQFAEGDKIVFLKNDKKIGVQNGLSGEIASINGDNFSITLETGKTISLNAKQYNYFAHGYAVTDYKSQGQTTSKVIIYSPAFGSNEETKNDLLDKGYSNTDIAEKTLNKSNIYTIKNNFNSFYVGITRGKEDIVVYTDDKELLKEQVKIAQNKFSTLDSYGQLDADVAFELSQVLDRADKLSESDKADVLASNAKAMELIENYKKNPKEYWSNEKNSIFNILQARRENIQKDIELGLISENQAKYFNTKIDIVEKKLLLNTPISKQEFLSLNISNLLLKNNFHNFFDIEITEKHVPGVFLSASNRQNIKEILLESKNTLIPDSVEKIAALERKLEKVSKISLDELKSSGVFTKNQIERLESIASTIALKEENILLKAKNNELLSTWEKENIDKPMQYKQSRAEYIQKTTGMEVPARASNQDLTDYLVASNDKLTIKQQKYIDKLAVLYGIESSRIETINRANLQDFINECKDKPTLKEIGFLKAAAEKRNLDISSEIAKINTKAEYDDLYKATTNAITTGQQKALYHMANKYHLDLDFQRINSSEASQIIAAFKDKPTSKQIKFIEQLSSRWNIEVDYTNLTAKDVQKIKDYTDELREIRSEFFKQKEYFLGDATTFVKMKYEFDELDKTINKESYMDVAQKLLSADDKELSKTGNDKYLSEAIKTIEIAKQEHNTEIAVQLLDRLSSNDKDILESEFKDLAQTLNIEDRDIINRVVDNNFSYMEAQELKKWDNPEKLIADSFVISDAYSEINAFELEKNKAIAQLVIASFDEYIFDGNEDKTEKLFEYSMKLSDKATALEHLHSIELQNRLTVKTYDYLLSNEEFYSAQKILEDISGSDNFTKFEKLELENKYSRQLEESSEKMEWKDALRTIEEKSRQIEHISNEAQYLGYDNDFEFER